MAILQINTQSAQYQTKLTQLNQIIDFYKPVLKRYLEERNGEAKENWRSRDPILDRLLQIHEAIERRTQLSGN